MTKTKDIEVARRCLADAQAALEDGDLLGAIGEIGNAAHFTGEAAKRDRPVATVLLERAGSAEDKWTAVYEGQTKEIEIHGKATVRIQADSLTADESEEE